MLGAIIGDIVGSRFEGKANIPQNFELITADCRFTDDTVHTIAIAAALKQHINTSEDLQNLAIKHLQEYGRRYLWCGCGDKFYYWLFASDPKPYESYGNGAIMRVSPCVQFAKNLSKALDYSVKVTEITHNHPDSIDSVKFLITAMWCLKNGFSKAEMYKQLIEKGYCEQEIIKDKFDVTSKGTLCRAIQAFMNGDSFEGVIRNAVLYGGDTDTTAAVAGSIAEAYYPIPVNLAEQALNKLDDYLCSFYIQEIKEKE